MNLAVLFHTAFVFWVILDPLGNIPVVLSLLRTFDHKKQRKIIMRELFFALLAMLFFFFFGMGFFNLLQVESSALQISAGLILFLIAIKMIFAKPVQINEKPVKEPFIVPIAIPVIAGPGILATITIYAGTGIGKLTILSAIGIAWLACIPCLLMATLLRKWFGENGLVAIERLFGYIIILLAIQMALDGLVSFFKI